MISSSTALCLPHSPVAGAAAAGRTGTGPAVGSSWLLTDCSVSQHKCTQSDLCVCHLRGPCEPRASVSSYVEGRLGAYRLWGSASKNKVRTAGVTTLRKEYCRFSGPLQRLSVFVRYMIGRPRQPWAVPGYLTLLQAAVLRSHRWEAIQGIPWLENEQGNYYHLPQHTTACQWPCHPTQRPLSPLSPHTSLLLQGLLQPNPGGVTPHSSSHSWSWKASCSSTHRQAGCASCAFARPTWTAAAPTAIPGPTCSNVTASAGGSCWTC